MPPSEPPKGTRSRRRSKPPPKPKPSAQNAQAYVSQGKAVSKAARQQKQAARARAQTVRAAPLDPTRGRPQPPAPTGPPPARVRAKPLQAAPPRNIRAGKPVVTKRDQRGLAVAAYDQLPSHAAKVAHVKAAQKRISQGKGTIGDKAVVHAHTTRVTGTRQRTSAVQAFNRIAGDPHKIAELAAEASTAKGVRALTKRDPVTPLQASGLSSLKLRDPGAAITAVGKASAMGWKYAHAPKIVQNVPKDIAELATTTPSSVAKLATTAVSKPQKVPGMLAQPYKDLAKNPKKFITEHPVSTVLMLQPGARVPGRLAGKAARLAGKQTLERPAATLPGTALRQERIGSRDIARRAVQARKDRKNPTPEITVEQVHRRVDAAIARAHVHGERVSGTLGKQGAKDIRKMPRKERAQRMEELDKTIGEAVTANRKRLLANEFGATAKVENGKVVEQPASRTAALHSTEAEAKQVADHLNAQNRVIRKGRGGGPTSPLYAREAKPLEFTTRSAGFGKHVVVPKVAARRMDIHERVGTSKAVPAVLLRHSRRAFSKAVLPFHPTWLTGQGTEGVLRTAVAGAGPTSWMRAHRLQARHPDLYKALAEEAIPGGFYGRTVAHAMVDRTLKAEIPESDFARSLTEFGKKPGIAQARKLNDAVTGVIFNRLNGQLLEGVPQKALLGRALKRHPLMDRKILGLSNKALDEFAKGGMSRETAVSLGQEVRRTYGTYAGFSPRMRSLIMHWTPFIPWYLNMARFLTYNLPVEHPVAGALAADIGSIEEQWRKENGLSLRYRNEKSVPPWMLGGFPVKGSSGVKGLVLGGPGENILRVGQYAPTASSTPTEQVGGLVLPQLLGVYKAISEGRDWKDQELKHKNGRKYNEGEKFIYGAAQLLEALTPGLSQVTYAAGAPEVIGGSAESDTTTAGERLKKLARPVSSVKRRNPQGTGGPGVRQVDVKGVDVKGVDVK